MTKFADDMRTARDIIVTDQNQITRQMAQLEAKAIKLQSRKEALGQRIKALDAALAVFDA